MFNTYLYQPLLQALLYLETLTGSLGFAIIVLTVVIRLILLPMTLPSMRASQKMRDLQPEIEKLKRKYKDDKMGMQQAQLALFQEHKVNPVAGCVPYLAQFVVLIALYRVFVDLLQKGVGGVLTTHFLWIDLTRPDATYILPVLAGVSQLLLGLVLLPATDTGAEKTLAAATPQKTDDKKADDMTQMASAMQQQMLLVMPIITAFAALRFPAGLALYWVVSTIFSLFLQIYVSGVGGLIISVKRAQAFLTRSINKK